MHMHAHAEPNEKQRLQEATAISALAVLLSIFISHSGLIPRRLRRSRATNSIPRCLRRGSSFPPIFRPSR